MILYFADRHMNVLGQASTELPKGLYISDDLKTEEVEAGVATLEFTLNYTASTRNDAKQYGSVGNYILRKNGDEQEFYTIITSEENIFKQEVEIYAEDAGMDLLNETVGEYKADKAYPASYYVEKFSDDSGFEIGINEVSNYNRKLSWEGETTASERILSVATQFDAEVSYTFEIDRLKIKHKYINLHKKRGVDQGRELRINREVKNIIVKSSVEDLATALSVTGGYPEDSETPINLKGYKYDDGDIYLSGSTIYSRSAVAKWSRYLSEKGNGTGHIVQTYTYDTLSQSELCNRAVSKLKKIYDAAVSYEVELAYLPDGIKIGDTVNIVDDAGELYLSARIMKLESSICNDEYTATLGEYKLKSSGISEKMESLAAQFEKLAKNRTFYTWVVFADTETGAGISLKSAGKAYMGIAYNQTTKQPVLTDQSVYTWVKVVGDQGIAGEPGKDGLTSFFHVRYADVPNPIANQMRKDTGKYIGTYTDYTLEDSTDPTKYTWRKFQGDDGEDGADGVPGNDGADGETSYLHMAYATSADGKTGFSTTNAVDKTYIGQYVDFVKADSTDPAKYRWSKFQGPKGDQGIQGPKGADGKDGKTTYFHIKYSAVSNPTSASQMTETPSKYIGTYVDFTQTDSDDPKKYSWQQLEGSQGPQGKQGISGINGADGKTSYLHIKYSNDGGKTFTGNSGEDIGSYIGTCVDYAKDDPTSVGAYKWAKIKGETGAKGEKGDTGKGVKSTAVTYQVSSLGTAIPAGTWSSSIPSASAGQYLWTRTVITYTDNTTSTIYSVSRMGTNGTNGANGTDGKSIGSVVNYYLATVSSSGVTAATGGWTTTVQSVSAAKKYLWNYEVVKYTDGTVASTTAPCIIGSYGDQGNKGDKGDTGSTGNGIKGIAEHYAVSASNSTVPTSWSSTVPTMTESNKYLWNYETITYTNGTTVDTTKRVIGVYGNKGATGATGSQGYSLVANVVRDAFTEYQWTTYGTINHEESWSSTSGIRNGCRIGDMFAIVGTATDTKNAHVAYYRSNTASGDLRGICISHTIIPRGATGATGSKGDKGDTGATGKGVKSTAVTYQVSSSGTSVPTGTWSSSVPSASAGQYLWTRTIMTYTDNTTSTLYSVGKMGTNGTNGATGSQGYSLVANVVRDAFTESRWTTYGTINHEETWSSTSGIRNGCRIGDMFAIVGTATDTKNAHVAYYRSNTASGDLKGLCISHTIIPRGATGATGPQGPQGVKGEADIKCYQLTGGSNQLVWSKLGTLTSAGDNSNFIIDIYTGSGYNGQASQNSQAEIVIKDGWQASASTTAAFGVSVTRQNCDDLKVQVRATASNQCDVWVYLPWSYSWGTYTVAGKYTSWATSQTTQTAEPTTGTLQNLAYRMNPENAAKVATNFLEFTSGTGLQVGNKTNGSWSGYRTKISASAFEILNQAGTTLAYYGDKLIQLGKNAKDAVIELCGGVGKIKVETKSGNAALSIQSEYIDIKGVHEAVFETSSSAGSCIAGAVDDSFVVNTYSDANNRANFDIGNGSIILESKKKGYQAEVEFYGCGWSGGVYTGAFAPTKAYSEKIMLGDSGRVWERLIVKNSPQVTSDRRAKTNIFPLGESKINKTDIHSELFDRLKPVQYRMIDGDGRICYGFVAQDVVEAMRELGIREDELDLVHHDRKNTEDGYIDTYSMVYTNLIAIITHELQLEKQRRSNLEVEVADLRSELESMRDNISGDTN